MSEKNYRVDFGRKFLWHECCRAIHRWCGDP